MFLGIESLQYWHHHLTSDASTILQEEAALAAAEVAFILQSARGRALQFAIAPDSPATPQQEQEPSPQQ